MNAKRLLCLAGTTLTLTCLASVAMAQTGLPESVRVPAGHKISMETTGVGKITYECRAKADSTTEMEWVFVGPDAVLNDRGGKQVGTYYGPPATWEAKDGSKVTGTQVAVAPSGAGNLPYQLVKASPAQGKGAMSDVAYIQRTALKGGVAPSAACTASNKGAREVVNYKADYIFWSAS